MARKSILSTFDALTPDADSLDPNWFSSPISTTAPTAAAPTPPTQITVESALTTSAPLLAGDPPDPDPKLCPRGITFTVPGAPGVTIHGEEGEGLLAGDLVFTATVNNTASLVGDLGGLFFQFNDAKLNGLQVTGPDVAIVKTGDDSVIKIDSGINMNG